MSALAELVAWGRAPSQTALLEELIGRKARRLRLEQEERRRDLARQDATQDPAFRMDLESVEVDFQPLDARGLVLQVNRLRWALCWAILGPTLGHEQGGRRPVLVISEEPVNRHSGLVTVLPLTTARRAPRPWVARLPAGRGGLSVDSLRLTAWSRTLRRERLVLPPLGWVTDPETRRTIAAYRHSEAGYLVERISASAASTRFEHDELGRVVQLTSPAGRVTRFEYDLGGRLTAAVDALG